MGINVKRGLSDNDRRELRKFVEYLRDVDSMPKREFLLKYQKYLNISDNELQTLLAKQPAQSS